MGPLSLFTIIVVWSQVSWIYFDMCSIDIKSFSHFILPGRLEFLLEAQQAYADYMFLNTPGVLAITAGLDAEDPNLLHDFQVFSSFQVFRDHADMDNPIVRKLLLDWINFDNYDASVPFYGEVWVEEEHLEEARIMTEEIGGAEFTFYPIDNVQGRVDLNNWE